MLFSRVSALRVVAPAGNRAPLVGSEGMSEGEREERRRKGEEKEEKGGGSTQPRLSSLSRPSLDLAPSLPPLPPSIGVSYATAVHCACAPGVPCLSAQRWWQDEE